MKLHENRVKILKVPVDLLTKKLVLDMLGQLGDSVRGYTVFTPNPEIVVDAQSDPLFCEALNQADLSLVDGKGLELALIYLSKISSCKVELLKPILGLFEALNVVCHSFHSEVSLLSLEGRNYEFERYQGSNLVKDLISSYPDKTFYFIGTRYQSGIESANEAFKALQKEFPNAKLVGSVSCRQEVGLDSFQASSGSKDTAVSENFGRMKDVDFELVKSKILSDLAKYQLNTVDFVFVGTGHKRQEFWIQKHKNDLPFKVIAGVGGTFDFIRGSKKRAPVFVQKLGLEWIFRLLQEPSMARFKRILKAFPYFPILVYFDSIKNKNSFQLRSN